MCRMAGIVFRNKFPTEVLSDLKDLGRNGEIPGEGKVGHPHGWGIASFKNDAPYYVGRSPVAVFEDPEFDRAVKDVSTISPPNIAIAHVRHASKGTRSLENTHPFIVDGLLLGHNGTIDGLQTPRRKPEGTTDSELLALHLAELFKEKGDLESAVKALIVDVIRPTKFTAAILMISDGNMLFGYRDYSVNENYYNLKVSRGTDRVVLFQESSASYSYGALQVNKGELVSVGLDLKIGRELVV